MGSKASKISFSGILCALSFVLLYLSSVIWLFAYFTPIMCSLINMIICKTFGKKYALTVYVATGILCLLFLPDKEPGLIYIFFFGYYSMIKDKLERIKPKILLFLVKLAIFNAGIISSQLVVIFVFGVKLDNDLGKWGIPLFIVLFNLLYLIFERLYPVCVQIYEQRLEHRLKNLIK